jgi:hypothetical protein
MNPFHGAPSVCFNSARMQHGTHTGSSSSREFAAPTRALPHSHLLGFTSGDGYYFWRFT